MNKTSISSAVALALGSVSFSANAVLTTGAVLEFTTGVKTCVLGGTFPNCLYNVADVASGSFFSMDTNNDGVIGSEKTTISMLNGVTIGTAQPATGSHGGAPDGTEGADIDNPWVFFCNTGMHLTTIGPTVVNDNGTQKDLDFSGWGVAWNGIPLIDMGGGLQGTFDNGTGLASITCSNASCSISSTFTLDYAAVVPQGDPSGFGGVPYTLHMEGHVGIIPVPAAAWLFGSGLLGLVGVARRRKARA